MGQVLGVDVVLRQPQQQGVQRVLEVRAVDAVRGCLPPRGLLDLDAGTRMVGRGVLPNMSALG